MKATTTHWKKTHTYKGVTHGQLAYRLLSKSAKQFYRKPQEKKPCS